MEGTLFKILEGSLSDYSIRKKAKDKMFGQNPHSKAKQAAYSYVVKPNLEFAVSGSEESHKVVIPISMNNPLHRGKALEALINYYKDFNPTILVADALQRHNYQHELDGNSKAIKLGDRFLEDERETLIGLKVERWDDWKKAYADTFAENMLKIEKCCQPNSSLYNACFKVWQSMKSVKDLPFECSLNYQKEEYAVILSMAGVYSHLIYPGDKTPAISRLYRLFSSCLSMPKWIFANIKKQTIEGNRIENLPVAYRVISSSFLELMRSDEVSPNIKLAIMETCLEQMSKQPEFTHMLQRGEHLSGSYATPSESDGIFMARRSINITFFGHSVDVTLKEEAETPRLNQKQIFQ